MYNSLEVLHSQLPADWEFEITLLFLARTVMPLPGTREFNTQSCGWWDDANPFLPISVHGMQEWLIHFRFYVGWLHYNTSYYSLATREDGPEITSPNPTNKAICLFHVDSAWFTGMVLRRKEMIIHFPWKENKILVNWRMILFGIFLVNQASELSILKEWLFYFG